MYYEMLHQTESHLQFVATVAIDESTAYAASYYFNGLFKIDLKTDNCEFIQFFPGLDICKSWLFFTAVQGENGIYFSPSHADYIALYDIGENKIHQLPLPELDKLNSGNNPRLGDAFYKYGNLYFVGVTCGCILKLEEHTGKISVIDPNIQDKVFFRRGMLVNDSYYIPSYVSPIILEYRLLTDETIIHKIEGIGGAWCLWGDGEQFWLPPKAKNDPIRCWNKSTGKTSAIEIPVADYQPKDMNFDKIFRSGNSLILSPQYANMFLKVNMLTQKIEKLDITYINNAERCGYYFETDISLYFVAYVNRQEIIDFKIEKNTLAVSRVHYTLKNLDTFLKAARTELSKSISILQESDVCNLTDFVTLVQWLS